MAYAYARLAKPEEGNWGEYEEGARKIRDAMVNQPFAVAGSKRIDTAIMEITKGRILAKVGAEAVYCLANLEEGVGLTFKIEDGSYRAINPVVLGSLKAMNWLTDEEYAQLEAQFPPVLKNHRGDVIGSIEVMFK
jgi:L-asparaginase II